MSKIIFGKYLDSVKLHYHVYFFSTHSAVLYLFIHLFIVILFLFLLFSFFTLYFPKLFHEPPRTPFVAPSFKTSDLMCQLQSKCEKPNLSVTNDTNKKLDTQ